MKATKIIIGHGDDLGYGVVFTTEKTAHLYTFDRYGNPTARVQPYIRRRFEIEYIDRQKLTGIIN